MRLSSILTGTPLVAAAGLLLCCSDPDAISLDESQVPSGTGEMQEGLDPTLRGTARVSCPGGELLTTLGWTTPAEQHQLGEVYFGEIDKVGEEPCIALRYYALLPDFVQGADQTAEPVTIEVDRGLQVEFGGDVPAEVRAEARSELTERAQFRLEGVSASWADPVPETGGYLGSDFALRDFVGYAGFVFIVTRNYAAEQVSLLDASPTGDGLLRYPGIEIETSYDCPVLPLGAAGVSLYSGVFLDASAESERIFPRTDLPGRFCPDLAGSARPPGNGALPPAAPP
jgi:hypothetical protein